MALTATATQGLEYQRCIAQGEMIYQPADPGDTITRGDLLVSTVGEGILDPAGASEVGICRAMKTMTMSASTTAFPYPSDFDPPADSSNSLVPVQPICPAGTPVFLMTFSGQLDETTVAAYTAGTPSITLTTSSGANDDINGGLVYVYEGAGVGQVNVVADYVHATKVATLHRKFSTAVDTTSKVIILEGEASASDGIGFFGRIDAGDQNNLATGQGADDGDWVVYLDFKDAALHLSNLRLPVIPAASLHMA